MKRYLALALLTLAAAGCDALTAHTDVVARAGHHELTVEETLDMVAENPRVPARANVIEQLAGYWIDYTLLATMVAEDSTLENFDAAPLLRPYVEQQTFLQLRGQVMTADTVIDDEELAQLYATEAPGVRLKARHILLSLPNDATEAQRDSVTALAEELRERAASGEDFSALAGQYSADQGSAQQGGDLGWFERGRMVQPFEEAAFDLEVGEVSDVVETPFGLHIIKLDDREVPSLDEVEEEFRQQVKDERRQASLNAYVDSLEAPYEFELQEGAGETVREIAQDPDIEGRVAERELLTWDGGAVTAGDVARVFQAMQPPQRSQFANLSNEEQLSQLIRDVATNELILEDAAERGISVPQAEQDSIGELIRSRMVQMARNAGLTGAPEPGETQQEAVERRVNSFMMALLTGQANVGPLGQLSNALRAQRETRINPSAVQAVVDQLEARRSEASGAAEMDEPPVSPQMPTPDTPEPESDTTG
jgi:peptidyl-prolyl cis-trans isomerase C